MRLIYRNNDEKLRDFMLKEDDILRLGRLILPATNLAISKARELFSGEPSMTLKVITNIIHYFSLQIIICCLLM